jgi:hypothetical protein
MLIAGVLTLYTSQPDCPQLNTCLTQLRAQGQWVILKPLSQLKQRQKPFVAANPGKD